MALKWHLVSLNITFNANERTKSIDVSSLEPEKFMREMSSGSRLRTSDA